MMSSSLAEHVNQNAEKLRTKFVNHERNEFVLGSDTNDWKDAIQEFMKQIDANYIRTSTVEVYK